ncbi:MAG TPA: hypothetical protein VFA93_00690 [Patescibacteria group bacterium]|nr:hypothetical protein [Patescibacteria group bacterium]
MALTEVRRPLVNKEGKPIVHFEGNSHRSDFIPGIYGSYRRLSDFLEKVILHAQIVGPIVSHNPEVRKIDLPKKGSSGEFLSQVYHLTKDVENKKERIKKVREMFEVKS